MDNYFKATKGQTSTQGAVSGTSPASGPARTFKPKQTRLDAASWTLPTQSARAATPSDKAIKRAIVGSLKDASNAITHSNAPERGYHVVSNSSGHQMSNNVRTREHEKSWMANRYAKLKQQGALAETNIFRGVTVYINGSTGEEAVNLQLISAIQVNGGFVAYAMSKTSCTHVVCENNLSGKKTNDEFNLRKSKIKVVRPAWILDSVEAGRRLPESQYTVLFREKQPMIHKQMLALPESGIHGMTRGPSPLIEDDMAWLQESEARRSASKSPVPPDAQLPRSGQRRAA